MDAVHQGVVAQHRDRQQGPPLLGEILSPGDTGVAVRRAGHRLNQRGIGNPGKGCDEKLLQRLHRVLLDAGAPLGLRLSRPALPQVVRKAGGVLQDAKAEGPVLQGHGVGDPAALKFDDAAVHDPLPELRHPVGRLGGTPADREEKGQALPFDL